MKVSLNDKKYFYVVLIAMDEEEFEQGQFAQQFKNIDTNNVFSYFFINIFLGWFNNI